MEENFDYRAAMDELESIAKTVEDPRTGIDDIDRYMKRAKELVTKCREYLRSAREKAEELQ